MNSRTTSGSIVMDDEYGVRYFLCRLDYTVYGDGSFEYVFTPNYPVIDILPTGFQGIPGLELELRKTSYIRKDIEPTFITERTPGSNRQDLWDLLAESGMDYLNRLEWLIRTDKGYRGDNLRVVRYQPPGPPAVFNEMSVEAYSACKAILSAIASGSLVILNGMEITDGNRLAICNVLRAVMHSHRSNTQVSEKSSSVGRRPIEIDRVTLEHTRQWIELGLKTYDEAASELGISRTTLYRRLKKL